MKLCPNCSKANEDFATICIECASLLPNESGYNTYGSIDQPQQLKTNGFAIASLVLGISAFLLVCCCGLSIIPSILAVVFGFLSKNKIRNSMGFEKGDGLALAGIILGFVGIALALFSLMVSPVFWEGFMEGFTQEFNNY